MMLYPRIEDCISVAGNKYTLAVVVAKRAKDLAQKMPGEFLNGGDKELSYALSEVSTGKIVPYLMGA